ERKELSLANLDIYDSNRVNLILGYITDSIKPLFAPEDYLGLSNGLYEMLINAVEHGNLGIDSEEKEKLLDAGTYAEILSKKVRENLQPVHVLLTNDREKIVIQITDQGKGFDHRARVEGKKELTLSGRGISIARHYFDEVNYSGTGNSVALVKYLKPLAK
ncbi:MAG: ATP-binding protein, partial [Spirochaetia bacterium]|nr:ATP-binding protein [Spirochaetia bacterium]